MITKPRATRPTTIIMEYKQTQDQQINRKILNQTIITPNTLMMLTPTKHTKPMLTQALKKEISKTIPIQF